MPEILVNVRILRGMERKRDGSRIESGLQKLAVESRPIPDDDNDDDIDDELRDKLGESTYTSNNRTNADIQKLLQTTKSHGISLDPPRRVLNQIHHPDSKLFRPVEVVCLPPRAHDVRGSPTAHKPPHYSNGKDRNQSRKFQRGHRDNIAVSPVSPRHRRSHKTSKNSNSTSSRMKIRTSKTHNISNTIAGKDNDVGNNSKNVRSNSRDSEQSFVIA